MTLKEMKIKSLSLIEELNKDSNLLTDDPDIASKINSVINQIQMELSCIKRINSIYQYDVTNGLILSLNDIPNFYQLNKIPNAKYQVIGNTIIFDIETIGNVKIYYYKYPNLIDIDFEATASETLEEVSKRIDNEYIFELSNDILEIAPYGIAADLLKNDMISGYGKYYFERYLEKKQMIDTRMSSGIITVEGGFDI